MIVKPTLAYSKAPDLEALQYPVLVQPKFDGIRAMVVDGVLVSRTAKPIRNAEIQAALGRSIFNGLDGELLVGSPCANDAMQRSSEFVMSSSKTGADWHFYVFDKWDTEGGYSARMDAVLALSAIDDDPRLVLVSGQFAGTPDAVNVEEARLVAQGYEGAILRDPRAPYKHGRSGKTGPLLKIKRWTDAEAVVIGVNEQMRNENVAKRDAFGRTERSTAKAGLTPAGTLGNLRCRTPEGVEFEIGTGFDDAQRAAIWADHLLAETASPVQVPQPQPVVGRLAKYKYVEVGVKIAPRFPVFLGFRDRDDV